MQPGTIARLQAAMPGTRYKLAASLGLSHKTICTQLAHLLKRGYAIEWGDEMTDKGVLVPVYHSTGKVPE